MNSSLSFLNKFLQMSIIDVILFPTRVTSFICKSLHAAMMSEWNEELYIEVELINKIALWIANQQDESGAFIETAGVIYDRNMDVRIYGNFMSFLNRRAFPHK